MPEAVAQKLQDVIGLPYLEGYGLTETAAPTHVNPVHRPKKQCAGIPFFDTDARVIDTDKRVELGPNQVGEIISRGPQIFRGYWKQPQGDRRDASSNSTESGSSAPATWVTTTRTGTSSSPTGSSA